MVNGHEIAVVLTRFGFMCAIWAKDRAKNSFFGFLVKYQ